MGNTLVLEVPAEVYEPLAETAERRGRTLEELAVEWLTTTLHHTVDDPVETFIGAFPSNIPGWADQHDQHLGLTLLQEMQGNRENDDKHV